MASPFRGLLAALVLVDQDGQRCAGLVLLSGLVVGAGAVRLLTGPLAQTSRFSLEVLTTLVLQLFGPLLVAVIALVRLVPDWVERAEAQGSVAWRSTVLPAGPLALMLMLLFVAAALVGGVLASPRADLAGELAEVLRDLRPGHLLRALLRCGLFLMAAAGWTLRETAQGLRRGEAPSLLVGDALLHSLVLVLILKLVWILAIDPLSFASPV